MKADVELTLMHDGEYWVGCNDTLRVQGVTLPDLDKDLKRSLRTAGKFPQGATVTVFMGFDFDTFPTWLRQYHTHYFNRLVSVDL